MLGELTPSRCTADGDGLNRAYIDTDTTFRITARDQLGHKFTNVKEDVFTVSIVGETHDLEQVSE